MKKSDLPLQINYAIPKINKTAQNDLHSLSHNNNTCLCKNKKPELVTTVEENEIVCKNCGTVFGFDEENNDNTIPFEHTTKSKINLYMKRQMGTRTQDYKKITYCKNLRVEANSNYEMMTFGIICDKLKLSDFITEQCWQIYLKLRHGPSKFTRAKSACLAIYQTCRQNKIPFSETIVRDVVCQSFGVKNAPFFKNVIFKIQDTDILKRGIVEADKFQDQNETKRQFYLNQHLSQAQKRHNIADITTVKRLAIQYYENFWSICLNDDTKHSVIQKSTDHDTLAKRAVSLAVQRCMIS